MPPHSRPQCCSPPPRRHVGRPAATSSECSVGFRASPQTRAASTRYAASAPTPDASAVPALMSSTPCAPWIRSFVGGLGATTPEGFKLFAFPELVGDFSPKELLGVIPAVECGNPCALEHR